jgi:hypothetical protein
MILFLPGSGLAQQSLPNSKDTRSLSDNRKSEEMGKAKGPTNLDLSGKNSLERVKSKVLEIIHLLDADGRYDGAVSGANEEGVLLALEILKELGKKKLVERQSSRVVEKPGKVNRRADRVDTKDPAPERREKIDGVQPTKDGERKLDPKESVPDRREKELKDETPTKDDKRALDPKQ